MSVTLRKRKNADDSISLVLDIYNNGERKREFLKHLKLVKPANAADRVSNKEKLQQAQAIAVTRASELSAEDYSMITDAGKKTVVTAWMQSYIDKYKKADKRNMEGVLNRFKTFLQDEKKPFLTFGSLTSLIIEDFIEYLESKSSGEGASSYYSRFKKMIKQAYRQRLIKENPLDLVERRISGKAKKKDVLTMEEVEKLSATETESGEVKRAFLFCCLTGLRWCDIKKHLKWKHVNLDIRELDYRQSKTGEDLTVPLTDATIKLLGKRGNANDLIFSLPSANGANKTVKALVKRAKIEKSITWHNARHSFGTNLILKEVGIVTTSKLLGHTSLKHTGRYVDTAAPLKKDAMNKLNIKL